MIIIIGFAALGFISMLLASSGDSLDTFAEGIFGAFLGAMIGFVLAMATGAIVYTGTTSNVVKTNLENIADNSSVHGSFFLGSGSIDGYPTYSWYEETTHNTFVRKDVDAGEAEVHYVGADETPYYTVVKTVPSHTKFLYPWGINMSTNHPNYHDYDFYVPRGSITQDYKLDAQG